MASLAGKEGKSTANSFGLLAKACDSCRDSPARVHCGADSAYLCAACDARVHGANGLASRHERTWLCEVCEQAPAAVTCKADAVALCAACDAEIHSANPLASRHERLPLLPFIGPAPPSPNAGDAASLFRPSEEDEAGAAPRILPEAAATDFLFFSDADQYLDLDCASSVDGTKTVGGPDPPSLLASDGHIDLDFAGSKPYTDHSLCHSMSSSEAAVVPDVSQPSVQGRVEDPTAARVDREAKVMRYREKGKSRRFEKTIRYASRKAYAEARPRIKGRFVKRSEVEEEVGRIYFSAAEAMAALVANDDCGVVPSF